MDRLFLIAGWLTLAFVAFVTLGPIYDRPEMAAPHLEHFAGFFMLGSVFVLAYPNRPVLVILLVVGSAVVLEGLQLLTPDRHGRVVDALMKMAGGACGITLTILARGAVQMARARSGSRD